MKCEKCGKNEATMYYKETVNGVTREMHLCPECAQKENLGGAFESAFQSMNHFWSDPFHSFLGGGFGSLWNDMLGVAAPTATLLGTERKRASCGAPAASAARTATPRSRTSSIRMCRRSTARRAMSAPLRQLPNSRRPIRSLTSRLS